ncbi:MAG: response regulator [Verrucomicrobiota bacterium]
MVEDDEAIRRVNTDVLINSGYEVDAAEDGASAWNALQRTDYDLVVTDNNMPKVTGVELIQKIQAAGLAVPVIMATGTMPDDNFDPFRSLQPAITLLKPFFSHELLSAVRRVLRAADDSLPEMAPPPNLQVRPSSPACSRRPT